MAKIEVGLLGMAPETHPDALNSKHAVSKKNPLNKADERICLYVNQFEFRITQTQNQQASCVFIYATPVSNFMQSGEHEKPWGSSYAAITDNVPLL